MIEMGETNGGLSVLAVDPVESADLLVLDGGADMLGTLVLLPGGLAVSSLLAEGELANVVQVALEPVQGRELWVATVPPPAPFLLAQTLELAFWFGV